MIANPNNEIPLRICFVCNRYRAAQETGLDAYESALARSLAASGHDVRVIDMHPQPHQADDFVQEAGVQIWRLRNRECSQSAQSARFLLHRAIGRWCKNDLVDIVHFPDRNGWAAGLPHFPVPVVVRLGGCETYEATELARPLPHTIRYVERAGLQRADLRTAASQELARRTHELFQMAESTDCVLYEAVDTRVVSAQQPMTQDVIFTGDWTENSGVLSLVYAWPSVCQEIPSARLHLFRSGDCVDNGQSLKTFLAGNLDDVAGTVHFQDTADHADWLQKFETARAALFLSYADASLIGPLSAMARGCPVICAGQGSRKELVRPERDGLLVDSRQPTEIANAIIRLLRDDSLARGIGIAGQRRVKNSFSLDQSRLQSEACFRRLKRRFRPRYAAARDSAHKAQVSA